MTTMPFPSANKFVRPSMSGVSPDFVLTALQGVRSARVTPADSNTSRTSTGDEERSRAHREDGSGEENPESNAEADIKRVFYNGHYFLHVGKPPNTIRKRNSASDSPDSDSLNQAPPALHYPSLRARIRRVPSAEAPDTGKEPVRKTRPKSRPRLPNSSQKIKLTPGIEPQSTTIPSDSLQEAVHSLVAKLEHANSSEREIQTPNPSIESFELRNSTSIPTQRILPVSASPNPPMSGSTTLKLRPSESQMQHKMPEAPTPSPITPPASLLATPSTSAKRPYHPNSVHSESPTTYKRPFFSTTDHGLRTQVRDLSLQLQFSSLENSKLRDEINDVKGSFDPVRRAEEEAHSQFKGLRSALQRITKEFAESKSAQAAKDLEIRESNNHIKKLDNDITSKVNLLEAQQTDLNSAKDIVKEQGAKLGRQELAINHKVDSIIKKSKEVNDKDAEINLMQAQLEKANKQLKAKDKLLTQRQDELAEKDALLRQKDGEIAAKQIELQSFVITKMLSILGEMGANAGTLKEEAAKFYRKDGDGSEQKG